MEYVQEPEPLEYALLDELISNLTASDEENLGMYREDDVDGYWTADEGGPATPPRLRTSSPRGPNEPSRPPCHPLGHGNVNGRYLQALTPMSTTASSVSSVSRSRANSSATLSSESSVSASSATSSTLVDDDPADGRGRLSPDSARMLAEIMTALSLSPTPPPSPQSTGSVLASPEAGDIPLPTPDGEGKTYEIGVHTTDAWWKAASIASLSPHTRPRKIRDDSLRRLARAAAERNEAQEFSDSEADTEAEDSSGETVQGSPASSPYPSPAQSPSPTPPSSPAVSRSLSPFSRPPSPPVDFVIPPRPYIAPRPRANDPKFYAVTAGLEVGVFDDWLMVGPIVNGVSKAVYKSYLHLEDAQDAFDRTLARQAVHVFADRREGAGAPLPRSANLRIPRYARGNISPAHADSIVVFRGREIGVFYDWLDCADHVLGIQDSVYNAFASYEAAWNAWYAAVREDYPRRIDP